MKKSTFFICLMLILANVGRAQTIFWSDTFEDTGAPSSGTRKAENDGGINGIPYISYFVRAAAYQIITNSSYTGIQGNKFWAGENHSQAFGAGKEEQQIDYTGINISGKANLSFKGLFAANSASAPWESKTDYVIVEYRIDSGTYQPLIKFFANADKVLSEDTNNDSIGDASVSLNAAFVEYTKTITGTGSKLDLRIKASSNDANEEWAIDNFRLLEVIPCNLTSTKGTVKNVTCKGGKDGAASITVSGANGTAAYNWTPGNPAGDGTASVTALVAGTYTCTVTDAVCSKVIEVVVTEPDMISTTQKLTICTGKSVKVGIHTYTTTGKYTDILQSAKGCDSTVITDLTVTPALTKNQEFTVCYGKSVTVGTHTYNMSGTYTDTFKTAGGCDSIVTTKLTVLKENKTSQTLYICKGKSVTVGTHVYTASGIYTDVLKATNGCDSTVTTYLNVTPAPTYSQQLN
ncbi:MAG TPA: SprB repeat-containing protein, partial [Bacteroidia bacterium]|nr:SprB repeat-containing protein [Bacteroidia bacterium]